MQIPEDITKCVCFLFFDKRGARRAAGTAFWVGIEENGHRFPYLITAKHVIDGIRDGGDNDRVYARINTAWGKSVDIETKLSYWLASPSDPYLDVAACPFVVDDKMDIRVLPTQLFLSDEVIKSDGIGAGDEVFITGLFSAPFGDERNLPVIRVGNIAAMPGEKVLIRWRQDEVRIDAYLIECKSIGGLSGSPVFVHLGPIRIQNRIQVISTRRFYFIGLVHGHFDANKTDVFDLLDADSELRKINMGIAIVIPFTKILEVLNQTTLKELRDRIVRAGR